MFGLPGRDTCMTRGPTSSVTIASSAPAESLSARPSVLKFSIASQLIAAMSDSPCRGEGVRRCVERRPVPAARSLPDDLHSDRPLSRADLVEVREIDPPEVAEHHGACLLYTSDAADDLLCVDLGGRRII